MADGTVGVRQHENADRLIDNEVLVIGSTTVYRQRVSDPELQALISTLSATISGTASAVGSNSYGSVLGVTPTATATFITFTAPASFFLRGFSATGTGDGYFALKVNGSPILSGRIHVTQKSMERDLDIGQPITVGSTVELTVTNEAEASADYEGTIFGELRS